MSVKLAAALTVSVTILYVALSLSGCAQPGDAERFSWPKDFYEKARQDCLLGSDGSASPFSPHGGSLEACQTIVRGGYSGQVLP